MPLLIALTGRIAGQREAGPGSNHLSNLTYAPNIPLLLRYDAVSTWLNVIMRLLRPDPIIIEAPELPETPEDASAVIFLHGLGDDGESFRGKIKLPRLPWLTSY